MEKKKKKSIFKRWWFWVIVVIIIVGIGSQGGGEESDKSTEVASTNTKSNETKADENKESDTKAEEPKEEPKKEAKEGVLTEEKFNQIESGMTYDEVKNIIGSDGSVLSETGEKGTEFYTVIYEWETDGVFSNANFTFQGDKLLNKSQIGVTDASDATITKEEFDKISNGMTYEQIVEIIGGEGDKLSESGNEGDQYHTVMYMYNGEGDLGANANFTFQGGKLQNKSQMGLK